MGEQWTIDRVLSLAPDSSSAKAGRELASPRKWQNLGRNEAAAWGECQGSGAKPYQTQIDLSEPAFKCSCPSRKFPCKHGLGLFLILAQSPDDLAQATAPGWVDEWLASRAQRAEKQVAKQQEAAQKPPDLEAQAKRSAEREDKVAAGMDQLSVWLNDVVSRGLAAVRGEGPAVWEKMAARMVDAQATGVARLLREAAAAANSGDGWQDRLLLRIARLHLLLEGYQRLPTLPAPMQAEIRTLIGWAQSAADLATTEAARDQWGVLGQRVELEGQLRVQRTWLWGETLRRPALLLQFAHGMAPFADTVAPGTQIDASLTYYAGAYPLRAVIRDRHGPTTGLSRLHGYATIAGALEAYAGALAQSPWVECFPMALEAVCIQRVGDDWALGDSAGQMLPIVARFPRGWQMLAQSGGHPVGVFGEWNGERLLPLLIAGDGTYWPLVKE